MKRKINLKRVKNKKVINATKITNDCGIHFRSRIEEYTYRKLQDSKIQFKYEEFTFTIQEGFTFNQSSYEKTTSKPKDSKKVTSFKTVSEKIRPITYTPDFVFLDGKNGWVIETKGYATDSFILKWKMFKKHLIDNGYNVVLFKPSNQKEVNECIELIKLLNNEQMVEK